MLDNTKNILISGGTFNDLKNSRVKGIDLLREGIAAGAFHNSSERYEAPKCHPHTRLAVLNTIMDWIRDGQKTSFVMWLYGPAGAGKSAIAQTIAEMCNQESILAASFFWSRNASGRNDERRLVTSLAYQLVVALPQIRTHVEDALENDPVLLSRTLEAQIEHLIVQPLNKAFPGGVAEFNNTKLVVLDGLDECSTPETQKYVIQVISNSIRKISIPLIFLIASRPEKEIRDMFSSQPLRTITLRLALDNTYRPDDDIRLFLLDSFYSLKREHTLGSTLPRGWPRQKDVNTIVQKSSGQFIYAATVLKFVSSPRRRPDEQLNIIIGISDPGNNTPFAVLDALYRHIFSSVEDLPRALEIISSTFLLAPRVLDATLIEIILGYRWGDLQLVLIDLHSVLDVPEINDDRPIRTFHASLQDFLRDPKRSQHLYIDEEKAHAQLTRRMLGRVQRFTGGYDEIYRGRVNEVVWDRLVSHCLRSSPTIELLQDLFLFDIQKWVSFGPIFFGGHELAIAKEVLQLSAWFRQQDPVVKRLLGQDASLYGHHAASLDLITRELMLEQYFKTESGRHYLTAITHPLLLTDENRTAMHSILLSWIPPREFPLGTVDSILFPVDSQDKIGNLECILQLQEFVQDRNRAGSCYVDGRMYADLSLQIVQYIFEHFMKPFYKSGVEWAIVESLPFFLSRADCTQELSDYLNSHPLGSAGPLNITPYEESVAKYLEWTRRVEQSQKKIKPPTSPRKSALTWSKVKAWLR